MAEMARPSTTREPLAGSELPGIERHPHARAMLEPALAPGGEPSHAYLFHGPTGTGKREIAREFAAALLAAGAPDPEGARQRVRRGTHPDLTWVTPSGAAEMLVADVEEPVVAAASRTPFEASRRVFVIEAAHTLNDQAANRLLKTLEEPPPFAHLLLLSERREDVLATVASRCLQVRFDPLPAETIAERLLGDLADADPACVRASARLALGNAGAAAHLLEESGRALRDVAEGYVRPALAGETRGRPWSGVLGLAADAGSRAGEQAVARLEQTFELVPARERRRLERETLELRRRAERRGRAAALSQALRLVELWLRDLLCLAEGAPEVIYNVDRIDELEQDLSRCSGDRARAAIARVQDTRLRLSLNVSEELALEALAYRLAP